MKWIQGKKQAMDKEKSVLKNKAPVRSEETNEIRSAILDMLVYMNDRYPWLIDILDEHSGLPDEESYEDSLEGRDAYEIATDDATLRSLAELIFDVIR
jgi:hypothetical protein